MNLDNTSRGFVQKKLRKTAEALWPILLLPIFLLGGSVLFAAGCATSSSSAPTASSRRPPVPEGIYVSKHGEAAAELDSQPDLLFEQAVQLLRKDYRVTFINSSIRRVEGENRLFKASVKITPLLTGKTGVCVLVKRKDRETPDIEKASALAAALLPVGVRIHAPAIR